MKTHPMKLVTIIAEALSRDPLERLLREAGAQGFTLSAVEGRGAHGVRTAEIGEYANIRVEAVVSPEVAARLLTRLESDFLPRYAAIAYATDVAVLRPGKFHRA